MSTNAHIGIYRGKNKVEFIYLFTLGWLSILCLRDVKGILYGP